MATSGAHCLVKISKMVLSVLAIVLTRPCKAFDEAWRENCRLTRHAAHASPKAEKTSPSIDTSQLEGVVGALKLCILPPPSGWLKAQSTKILLSRTSAWRMRGHIRANQRRRTDDIGSYGCHTRSPRTAVGSSNRDDPSAENR